MTAVTVLNADWFGQAFNPFASPSPPALLHLAQTIDANAAGNLTLQASTTYANDAAAAAGGVAIGAFYRNGSVVQIRIA